MAYIVLGLFAGGWLNSTGHVSSRARNRQTTPHTEQKDLKLGNLHEPLPTCLILGKDHGHSYYNESYVHPSYGPSILHTDGISAGACSTWCYWAVTLRLNLGCVRCIATKLLAMKTTVHKIIKYPSEINVKSVAVDN